MIGLATAIHLAGNGAIQGWLCRQEIRYAGHSADSGRKQEILSISSRVYGIEKMTH